MEGTPPPIDSMPPTPSEDSDGVGSVLEQLRQARKDVQPIGKTEIIEIPGYQHLMAIEFQYVDAEVTEQIAKQVINELRSHNGSGTALLTAIDLIIASTKQIMVRDDVGQVWRPIIERIPAVKFDEKLASLLKFNASSPREVVLGVFGSQHAILGVNMTLSQWLANVTRKADADFFTL